MRTAPAPNMVAIPGMNPGAIVAGGGGGAGGGSGGSGKGKKKGKGKDGEDGGDDAEGGGKDGKGGEGCGDPVCPITGKMFLEVMDFAFWATKELKFIRHYSSRRSDVAGSFGFGWTHPFGWQLEERRRAVFVYDDRGDRQKFARPVDGGPASAHPFGWTLARVGNTYRLTRDGGEVLTFERHPAARKFLLRYLSDVRGNTTTVEYDERGRFIGLIDSERRPFRATLDELGRIVRFQVPTEPTHQNWMDLGHYRYDEFGDLVEYIDAVGFSWQYRYHNHLMVEHRSGCGLSYLYRYDGEQKDAYCIETWGEYVGRDDPALLVPISEVLKNPDPLAPKPKGINYVKLTYLKDQFSSEVENGLGGVTRYIGDSYGRVIKKVLPDGSVTERQFNPDTGAVSGQTNADGEPGTVVQRATGGPLGFVRPDGTARVVLRPEPYVEEVRDVRTGALTRVHYSEYGEQISRKFPDGTFEVIEYDARGLTKTEVDRSGGTTRYVHDDMANLVEVHDPHGGVQRRKFDYLGRCVLHVDAAGQTTQFAYDGRSEVTHKRLHDGTDLFASYDANRKATSLQIANRVYRFEYGGLSWMTRRTEPDGMVIDFRYDVEGNLVWIRRGDGAIHTLERDTIGRIARSVDFEGQVQARAHDGMGRVVKRSSARGTDVWSYDLDGQLIEAETPDATIVLGYAPTGKVAFVDTGTVVVHSEYDETGQLVREHQNGVEARIGWEGGLPTIFESPSGVRLEWTMAAGVPVALDAGPTKIAFVYPRPREKVLVLGDRLVRREKYDDLGFLRWATLSRRDPTSGIGDGALGMPDNSDQILRIDYEYNVYGELVRERRTDGRTIEYDLDQAGRIKDKTVQRHGQIESQERLRYDAIGSPILENVGRDGLGRVVQAQNDHFEYDEAGRLVARVTDRGRTSYEWDAEDNLRRVVTPDHIVEMTYDGRGRRMEKRVFVGLEETESVRYVWENQILLREIDEYAGKTRTYLRQPGDWAPFGHVDSDDEGSRSYFYVADRSGCPDLIVDEQGTVVWEAERTVFGAVENIKAKDFRCDVRFAGQLYDEHVGLVYNRLRWYEPRVAQYVLPDRVGLDGGLNFRDYVTNPTTYVDPMGLAARPSGTAGAPVGNYPTGWGNRPNKPTGASSMTPGYMTTPGHWATEGTDGVPGSIVCSDAELKAAGHGGGAGQFSADTTKAIDAAGDKYGCHTCGTKNPLGPDAGETDDDIKKAKDSGAHFVPDHIPPAALHTPRGKDKRHEIDVPKGGVRLFPQCRQCSNQQKNDVSSEKHRMRREGGDDEDDKVAGVNAGAQAAFEKNKQVKPPTPPPAAQPPKKKRKT